MCSKQTPEETEDQMLESTVDMLECLIDCLITGTVNSPAYEFTKRAALIGLEWFENEYKGKKKHAMDERF